MGSGAVIPHEQSVTNSYSGPSPMTQSAPDVREFPVPFDSPLLAQLRAEFNWRNPPPDPLVPESRQLLLINRVIDTTKPATNRADVGRAPVPTTRGTLPFLIQFAGPVSEARKNSVRQAGGILRGYMPVNGWVVELNPAACGVVRALSDVQWVGAYEPSDKLQPVLAHLLTRFPGDDRAVELTISCFDPGDASVVAIWLKARGQMIHSEEARSTDGRVRALVSLDVIPDLVSLGAVQGVEETLQPVLYNDKAVISSHMNATSIWSRYGLTGKNQIVGHADTGLDVGSTNGIHPDFAGQVQAVFAWGRVNDCSDTNGHGTHTAGSILGNGAMSSGQYRGVAWESRLVHQSVMSSYGSLSGLTNLTALYQQSFNNGSRIHSDSWGDDRYLGVYTALSRDTDEFMWNHPEMLIVFAAGNSGVDKSPANGVVDSDSIGSPGTAKNVLTVGAMENDREFNTGGYTWRQWGASAWPSSFPSAPIYNDLLSWSYSPSPYLQGMAAFSSRGPTDDGRFKPDVVAPGTDVISVRSRVGLSSGWGVAANTNYMFDGGTSMACPLVAGSAALVRQYLVERAGLTNPTAALVKAMMIGGARSMTPGQYGTDQYREIPAASPNNVEGYGQVDVGSSVYPTGLAVRCLDWQVITTGKVITNMFTVAASNTPVSVVLAWSDCPRTDGASRDLVNDLDLTLEGPTGLVYYANGGTNFDRLNTVEAIRLTSAAAGIYKARITGYNVPVNTQRCALVVRAAMDQSPELRYSPPAPVLLSTNACPISALVTYFASLTNGEVRLCWTTNAAGGLYSTNLLSWSDGHSYTGAIPAQTIGTVVSYYLSATVSVYDVRYPSNAPASLASVAFSGIPVSLDVFGTRTNSTVVTPDYGHHSYPSGSLVQATAQAVCTSGTTWRFLCNGWTGTGLSPTSSNSANADVTLNGNATLTWQWNEEVLLTQNSSPAGAVDQTSWHVTNSLAATVEAWAFAWDTSVTPEVPYGLAGWIVDDVLWTNSLGQAPNPATGIFMNRPRTATAWYLPYWLDSDANELLDWWEYRNFGSLGIAAATDDPDGDGWMNYYENLDNTDPLDDYSFPTPPGISFTPLVSPQTSPPPWLISAVITDNFTVADVAVFWTANGGPVHTNSLTYVSSDMYQANIDPGGGSVVTMLYQLAAADLIPLQTDTAVFSTDSLYPILRFAPTNFGTVRLTRELFSQPVTVANDGNQPLSWQAVALVSSLQDSMENGTNGWAHAGSNDTWHLSKRRFASSSNAWYCGSESLQSYSAGMNARLVSTALTVGANGVLSVHHWLRAEPGAGTYYWDGGVVRISTNGGQTYSDIAPIGGYPHRIVPNVESPFAANTPCFGSNDWIESRFDLSVYSGAVARIAFVFGSDMNTQDEGWYIDDVWIGSTLSGLSTTGVVADTYVGGVASNPFSLTMAPLALRAQADVAGAIRMDHSAPGHGGLDLIPFHFRRPAFLTVENGSNGFTTPVQADLLDAEGTTMTVVASSGARITSISTNGVPVPEVFSFGSTQYTRLFQGLAADVMVTTRFARVWNVTVGVHGPGTAQPLGTFPVDEGLSTNIHLQADANQMIWNVVVNGAGVPAAGGVSQYILPINAVSTNHDVMAAFGGVTLTGLPVAVEAAWMRQYFPGEWNFDALAVLDTDADGMVTWEEYVARTIPTNTASVLRIDKPPVISNDGSHLTLELHFLSVSGRIYQAQSVPDMGGIWSNTGDFVTATGAFERIRIVLPSSVNRSFFRVSVLP